MNNAFLIGVTYRQCLSPLLIGRAIGLGGFVVANFDRVVDVHNLEVVASPTMTVADNGCFATLRLRNTATERITILGVSRTDCIRPICDETPVDLEPGESKELQLGFASGIVQSVPVTIYSDNSSTTTQFVLNCQVGDAGVPTSAPQLSP